MTVVPAVSRASLVRIATEDFIRRPLMWIEAISNREDVCAIAPDFAYLACARAIKMIPPPLVKSIYQAGMLQLLGLNPYVNLL